MFDFTGYGENMLTLKTDETSLIGKTVAVVDEAKVASAEDGVAFFGICRVQREGIVSVQTSGYAEMNFSGTAPIYGATQLCGDGNGGVRVGEGRQVTVIHIIPEKGIVGFIF